MSKITLNNIGNLTDTVTSANNINANSAVITTAMNNTLSRDGTNPNQMNASIDMNGHSILNLPLPVNPTDPVRLLDVGTPGVSAAQAAASATAAAASATSSATSATTAQGYVTGLSGTSTTSLLIATGAKTFTANTGKNWATGQFITATSNANSANYMHGTVTSYVSNTGVLITNILDIGGSGTFADWNITISGTIGPIGATGAPGSGSIAGATLHGIGIATGATAMTSTAVMTDGQLLVGQSAADPLPKTLTGDVTITAAGVTAIKTSPTLVTPILGVAASTSEKITGTAGAGFTEYVPQSSPPFAPATGYRKYADATGRIAWIRASDGFSRIFDSTLTADRVYTLPNLAGTIALTSGTINTVKKQLFTVGTSTYTPSAGMLYCIVECVGPGGGGGGATGSAGGIYAGAGGGSGGYSRSILTAATVGASKTVVVGAHGNGGATGSNNGVAGAAQTTFGATLVIANQGQGGSYGSSVNIPSPGTPSVAATGDLATPGIAGNFGLYCSIITILTAMGAGANSVWGSGGAAVTGNSSIVNGNAGIGYGSGGGGGNCHNIASTAAGGNGADGACFITEFCNQ
jgi:hypothetical protein